VFAQAIFQALFLTTNQSLQNRISSMFIPVNKNIQKQLENYNWKHNLIFQS